MVLGKAIYIYNLDNKVPLFATVDLPGLVGIGFSIF
jgi:hypothetical protein